MNMEPLYCRFIYSELLTWKQTLMTANPISVSLFPYWVQGFVYFCKLVSSRLFSSANNDKVERAEVKAESIPDMDKSTDTALLVNGFMSIGHNGYL